MTVSVMVHQEEKESDKISGKSLTIVNSGRPSSEWSSRGDFEAHSCDTSNQSSRELHCE